MGSFEHLVILKIRSSKSPWFEGSGFGPLAFGLDYGITGIAIWKEGSNDIWIESNEKSWILMKMGWLFEIQFVLDELEFIRACCLWDNVQTDEFQTRSTTVTVIFCCGGGVGGQSEDKLALILTNDPSQRVLF
ncbi:hypothetical protein WICPIJ_009488 [Wickerhamomyces pijperi]|uniref:Uncharacterized protein n=1 Tax=Wickerhamomyces pijperi TaxID=599730 RepID=A0A9P8PMH7_WICPI|nr:hypothetical protein WICPIJ_009488 [Wickerhamomyces pijperi]